MKSNGKSTRRKDVVRQEYENPCNVLIRFNVGTLHRKVMANSHVPIIMMNIMN